MHHTISPFHADTTLTTTSANAAGRQPSPERPPPDYMGTNHSQSCSGSAPSKKKAVQPIPVPRLTAKKKPPYVDYHIALDDDTIAKALAQTKLPHHGRGPSSLSPPEGEGEGHVSSSSPSSSPSRKPLQLQQHQLPTKSHPGREQRLSCLSFSTSASSSSASSGGSQGLSPQRGLQRSPALRDRAPPENSSEDEDDDDEDEEEEYDDNDDDNYGVGLEQDLQLRLQERYRYRGRLPLPGGGRSPPAALLILPRALKGQFRKVSGMLGSLTTTPEQRAMRRVAELARNKGSYFGCLVQDYVSFMLENGGGAAGGIHTSALDLLQTLRNFLTQMKAYLVHSSELQPPIESFIPEDQIGKKLHQPNLIFNHFTPSSLYLFLT